MRKKRRLSLEWNLQLRRLGAPRGPQNLGELLRSRSQERWTLFFLYHLLFLSLRCSCKTHTCTHLPLHFSTTENDDSVVETFENTEKHEEDNTCSHCSRRSPALLAPLLSFLGACARRDTRVCTPWRAFPGLCYCQCFAFLCLSSFFLLVFSLHICPFWLTLFSGVCFPLVSFSFHLYLNHSDSFKKKILTKIHTLFRFLIFFLFYFFSFFLFQDPVQGVTLHLVVVPCKLLSFVMIS